MRGRRTLGSTLARGLTTLALAASLPGFAQTLFLPGPSLQFVTPGTAVPGGVSASTVTPGSPPAAGIAVTFSAPASGASVIFANGSSTITVLTDADGIARADATANAVPGTAAVVAVANGQTASRRIAVVGPVTLEAHWVRESVAGDLVDLGAIVHMPWVACDVAYAAGLQLADISSSLTISGMPLAGVSAVPAAVCGPGEDYRVFVLASVDNLVPGDYDVDLLVGLPHGIGSLENRASLGVKAGVQVSVPGRPGALDVAFYGSHGFQQMGCTAYQALGANVGDAGFPTTSPPGFDTPYGLVRLDATGCVARNDFDLPNPPVALTALLGAPGPLADGTAVWAYGPAGDVPQPHWYALRSVTSNRFAESTLTDGGAGDDGVQPDGALHATLALAVPRNAAASGALQDLWWAGTQENGWGLSLTQHGERLFAGLFVYDAAGNPTWLVMPDGGWNAGGTVYTGTLYRPHGTRYDAYNAQALVVGAPVGILRINAISLVSIALDYSIDGVAGHKVLQRQRFGRASPFVARLNLADLWWGGPSQNGWGYALAQQSDALFGVFFTYDNNHDPTWFVAPAARLGDASSKLYRTRGSAWLNAAYDPARFSAAQAGTITYGLGNDSGTLALVIDGQPLTLDVVRQSF